MNGSIEGISVLTHVDGTLWFLHFYARGTTGPAVRYQLACSPEHQALPQIDAPCWSFRIDQVTGQLILSPALRISNVGLLTDNPWFTSFVMISPDADDVNADQLHVLINGVKDQHQAQLILNLYAENVLMPHKIKKS